MKMQQQERGRSSLAAIVSPKTVIRQNTTMTSSRFRVSFARPGFDVRQALPGDTDHLLTVRLLVSGTGTRSSELLRLTAAVVGYQERSVKLDESLLQRVLGRLIDVLLVVRNQALAYRLSDSVDLGRMTASSHSYSNIHIGKLVEANNQ